MNDKSVNLYFTLVHGVCKITEAAYDFSVVNCMLLIILSNIMRYNNGHATNTLVVGKTFCTVCKYSVRV